MEYEKTILELNSNLKKSQTEIETQVYSILLFLVSFFFAFDHNSLYFNVTYYYCYKCRILQLMNLKKSWLTQIPKQMEIELLLKNIKLKQPNFVKDYRKKQLNYNQK